jgi:MFS family permease
MTNTAYKIVYLSSYAVRPLSVVRLKVPLTLHQIYTIGAVVASRAQSMPVLIAMRCLQAFGSSAVVAVGAGSLADMFEVHERGKKVCDVALGVV